jgi:glucose-6-phosphate 1-dehydrogenase
MPLPDRPIVTVAAEHGTGGDLVAPHPDRGTETFAEVELSFDMRRWNGFVLRAGKALAARRKEAVVRFRPDGPDGVPSSLRIGIDGPLDVAVQLTGLEPMTLAARPPASDLPSVRGDGAEEAWRVVEPVLAAWRENRVPLEEYPAGSHGPPPIAR